MGSCNNEIVDVCCKDDIVAILRNLPHAFFIADLRTTFGLEEFAHSCKLRTDSAGHVVKRPLKQVAICRVFRIAGRSGNVNLAVLAITVEQFPLCKSLRNIHVIRIHIVLRSNSKKQSQTTGVRNAVESVFKISNARFILLGHTITSDD
jgi:hypothetical protein